MRQNYFGGAFIKPVSEIGYKIIESADSGGVVWYAALPFNADVYERR